MKTWGVTLSSFEVYTRMSDSTFVKLFRILIRNLLETIPVSEVVFILSSNKPWSTFIMSIYTVRSTQILCWNNDSVPRKLLVCSIDGMSCWCHQTCDNQNHIPKPPLFRKCNQIFVWSVPHYKTYLPRGSVAMMPVWWCVSWWTCVQEPSRS